MRRWSPCIRPGCMRPLLAGFPLCFEDWDELPAQSRAAWRACTTRCERENWQVKFHERYARRIPLERIVIVRPAPPSSPATRRKRKHAA